MDLERAADLAHALRDPEAAFDTPAARAHYALRSELLERLASALTSAGLGALLVKGAGLAHTVYPRPWLRDMSDVDMLVPAHERAHVVEALARAGCVAAPPDRRRPLTADAFDEIALSVARGPISLLVEVHTGLDKLVPRPIPYDAIRARSEPVRPFPGLRVPGPEDHALLVVLHAATSEFRHPIAFVDLELLFRAGLDARVFVARAHAFRLASASYVALRTLAVLGSTSVPAHLARALEPSRARRFAIAQRYALGAYPVARGAFRLGLPWALGQSVLRDDLGTWLGGLTRYAVRRAEERYGAR